MKATLKFDPDAERKFRDALGQIVTMAGKSMLRIMMEQMVLLIRDAVGLTPPFGDSPNTEKLEKQRAIGEQAIRRDLTGGRAGAWTDPKRGVFRALDYQFIDEAKVDERIGAVRLWAGKDGNVYGVERDLYRPQASQSEMHAHHQKHRSKRTGRVTSAGARSKDIGRWRFADAMVVEKGVLAGYMQTVFARVLTAKSGWVYAWQKFQVALGRTTGGGFTKGGREKELVGKGIPAALRKLRGAREGHYVNAGTEDKPVMEAGNSIPFVQRFADHVMRRTWNNRVRNIQKQAKDMAKEMAKALRQKGVDAHA